MTRKENRSLVNLEDDDLLDFFDISNTPNLTASSHKIPLR